MNIFNKIIIVILLLCIIAFSILAIIGIITGLFEPSAVAARVINFIVSLNPYILTAILFLVSVVAIILLVFEFYRRRITAEHFTSNQSGKTMLSIGTVSSQITEKLTGIAGMIDPQVKVVPGRKGIIINISSKLIKDANVAEKTKEIKDTASKFASSNLGFRVIKSNYTVVGFISPEFQKLSKYYNIKKKPEMLDEKKESKNIITKTPLLENENNQL